MSGGKRMSRWIAGFIVISSLAAATSAYAQETSPGPGKVEITMIPAGATYFTSKGAAPSFRNYALGGAFAYNANRVVGVEGELGGSLGMKQLLSPAGALAFTEKTPSMFTYTGNVVVHAPGHAVVPYATAGIGGIRRGDRAGLGITTADTFLTSNVGGGVKWFSGNSRWGLRGDYRFEQVRAKATAPEFFGLESRYGNRVYGGVVINAVK
jgi:hypothetical protein